MAIKTENAIYQQLDTNGDGTGTTSQNVNGSVTPVDYYIAPPAGQSYVLKRANILVIDANFNNALQYGALGAALTNGIRIWVEDGEGNVQKEFTSQRTIKRSYDWVFLAGSDSITVGSANADPLKIRWTFARGYDDIRLNGDNGEKFIARIQDSLAGLDDQVITMQGYKIDNKTESNLR